MYYLCQPWFGAALFIHMKAREESYLIPDVLTELASLILVKCDKKSFANRCFNLF